MDRSINLGEFSELENTLYSLLDHMRKSEVEQAAYEGRKYQLHGLCAVQGYDPKLHASYFKIPGVKFGGEDIFQDQQISLYDLGALAALQEAMEIDGAILIGKDGRLMHSGKFMLPDFSIYERHQGAVKTYERLQENGEAGTRHVTAVALSALLPELTFTTLKSDRDDLRQIRGGYIVRSTVPGEVNYKVPTLYQQDLEAV
ncbi:hypothetical protein HYV87_04175 [Candidatus Woesearchaeota archaeon]|nr:hypothetical protein [Candidatus Woesearchaeota archaeon]